MKKRTTAAFLFLAAFVAGSFILGAVTRAQTTTTTPLTCTSNLPSVAVGQPMVLTANGGNGTYTWSGAGLTLNNPTGKNFTVTYNVPGIHAVNVSSGGQTATCTVSVTGTGSTTSTPTTPTPTFPNTGGGAAAALGI